MNQIQNLDEAVATARRLRAMGVAIRSSELSDRAKEQRSFVSASGNRAMRRARRRAMKKSNR